MDVLRITAEEQLILVRQRHIRLMEQTLAVLHTLLANVDAATATTRRDPNDGAKGWTTLEVLCHLRDFDEIFYQRACLMADGATPPLPGYDHEALVIERNYNGQELTATLADLTRSRQRFVAFFHGLSADQWQTAGIHPERGYFTMTDAVMQVGLHDVVHLDQISRILADAS